jgi:hypothetical protein
MHALSTCHNPIKYRLSVAPGSYLNDQNQRGYVTPALQGVSTAQQMSQSMSRLACDLAVVGGVRLRHLARLFAALCLMPLPPSALKRWMDASGSHFPTPAQLLRPRLLCLPVTECHRAGSSPLGTDHGGRVGKDAHDRLLIPHEAAAAKGDDAQQWLQRCQERGLQVTAAFSESSPRCTDALTAG